MKNLFILVILFVGIFIPASAETLNYRIIQDGSGMMIIPSYNNQQPSIQKPVYRIESIPAKIPYYSSEKTLPKAKNRNRSV